MCVLVLLGLFCYIEVSTSFSIYDVEVIAIPATCLANDLGLSRDLYHHNYISVKGGRLDLVVRALFPSPWPRFNFPTRCHMWIESVDGSLLCSERFFPGYSGFPLSSKISI